MAFRLRLYFFFPQPRKAALPLNPRDRERAAVCSQTPIQKVWVEEGEVKIACYFHCWQFRFRGISSAVPSSVELNKSSSRNSGKAGGGRGCEHFQLNPKRQAACKHASSAWNKSHKKPESQPLLKQDAVVMKQNAGWNPCTLAECSDYWECAPQTRRGCVGSCEREEA